MKILPLVSIIIATYNSDDFLNQAINSILVQTYPNYELIIIDGGSTDNTIKIVKSYEEKINYWISEPDRGVYDAWNKGITVAKGDWICFVGSDDVLLPTCLFSYVEYILNCNLKLEFISSRIELVRQDLSVIQVVGEPWSWQKFKRKMVTYHLGCFHSKELFNKYGVFNSSYKVSGDYEMLLRPRETLLAGYIPNITAKMRTDGISNTQLYKAIKETYLAKATHGIMWKPKSLLLTYIDIVRIFLRKNIS